MLGAALTTAPTWQATSESALTRSMSTWSITAMSPGRSRLVSVLVRRSSRAVPVVPDPVSEPRLRRRVPMRMARMVPRRLGGSDVRRAMAIFRSPSVSDTRSATDTPVPPEPPSARDGQVVVASVAVVTGVARVATRTSETSGAALPAARPAQRAPEPPGEGAVVRPLPTEPRPLPFGAPAAPPAPAVTPPATVRRAPGKRELKRQETRERIVDAATDLFAERGFDAVSVMEIARRAGVVEKTVFNHFPVKEGLVFDADPPVRAALLETVRRRPAGESVSAAAGTFVVSAVSLLGTPEAADGVARMARIIRGSRTLQVREREIIDDLTTALADLIAGETDARSGQLEPWLAAHAVLGLYASLLELARDRVLAGVGGPELSAELRRQGRRGLALLQFGLAGYAKRR